MADIMLRFICPRCSSYLKQYFNRGTGGKFHGCETCFKEGRKYSVEWDAPHKAYGDVAEDMGVLGVSQEFQEVPTKRFTVKVQRAGSYRDILIDGIVADAHSDFRKIREMLPSIHALGGPYKKKDVAAVRTDLEALMMDKELPEL